MNRIDRISAILVQLQSRPVVRAGEMAERFGVSLRTIYRDIRTLGEAGVPVCGDAGVGYSLVEGYRLPPLMFTKEEAVAFLTAEKFIEQLTDKQNSGYFRQGMDKVRAVLRSVDKHFLSEMGEGIAIYRNERLPDAKLPNLLQTLLESITGRRAVNIAYYAASRDALTERVVEPLGVIYLYPFWHLYAYCRLRNDYRDFRLDRIEEIRTTETPFSKAHPPLKTLLDQREGCQATTEVVVRVDKPSLKRLGYAKFYLGLVSETECDDGWTELTFLCDSLEYMARWLLANVDRMTVVTPPELKDITKNIIEKIRIE